MWVPSPLTSKIESNNFLITSYVHFSFFFASQFFFGKTSHSNDYEYFLNMRVNSAEGTKEWYFCVPDTVFADANLLLSSWAVMAWFSLGPKNTKLSTKFFFGHWYKASAVKIGYLDDACRLARAASLQISPNTGTRAFSVRRCMEMPLRCRFYP